jgi:hypothetical protein
MSGFLNSLKADLLESRTRALLLLMLAALAGAVAYAVLGGGSNTPPPPPTIPTGAGVGSFGIAAVPAPPNTRQALAEVTSGAPLQRDGASRDPFAPLPGALATVSSPASGSSTNSKSGSSGSSTGKSGGTKATSEAPEESPKASKPSRPAKPKTVYHVEARFGPAPAGTPPQNAQLSAFENLRSGQKLPTTGTPLVAFEGVTAGGRRAKFKLLSEAFLRGVARCMPSVSLCQAITLAQGEFEEIEYLPPGAPPVVYELQVVKITPSSAAAASVRGGPHRGHAALAHRLRASVATAGGALALAGYGSAFATRSAH